jgi:phosphatidylethanolamine-binding protein (PEBP) family uncharacterized protein
VRSSPRAARRALLLLAVAGLALAGGACGDDGKTLRDPPPGATAPLRPTSTTVAPGTPPTAAVVPGLLSLTSSDFQPSGPLAIDATCAGAGRSPALAWTGLPPETVEVAVVMVDADADLFTHWVVAGLDPAGSVGAGAVPAGAVEALNGDGTPGYAPPCPPEGESHLLELTLYALTAPSGVTAEMTADQAVATLDGASSSRAVVTATATGE